MAVSDAAFPWHIIIPTPKIRSEKIIEESPAANTARSPLYLAVQNPDIAPAIKSTENEAIPEAASGFLNPESIKEAKIKCYDVDQKHKNK